MSQLLDDIIESIEVPTKRTKFKKPPTTTFLIWYDNVSRRGGDLENRIDEHAVSFELYAYNVDEDAEQCVEEALDAVPVEWQRTDRQWLDTEQLYITIYDFSFIEKE